MCVFQISWCLVFPKIASALIPDLHFEILFWRETWGLESKSFPPPLPPSLAGWPFSTSLYFDTVPSSLCLYNSYRARASTGKLGLPLDDRQDSSL